MKLAKITTDAEFEVWAKKFAHRGRQEGGEHTVEEKAAATREIVDAVRERGDAAVADFTERFDGEVLDPDEFELGRDEIEAAAATVETGLIETLKRAQENIRRFHEMHLRQSWEEEVEEGVIVGQRITPIESAGVYVPGGKAFYPSSVLMNIVAAQVAGVNEIVMVSPPSFEGTIHPVVLAAANIAGASRVFRVGGAQAIAALAYGTEHIPRVLKITGPGNTFVTLAKRLVTSACAIDSEAGPSEVTVIADARANAACVAGELLAQAEHDEEAQSVLITPSEELAKAVQDRLESETATLSRSAIIRKSLEGQGLILVVRNLDEAVQLSNLIAPEHLAVYTERPRALLEGVTNAGAIILGEASTVVLGDYFAGPNHVLPTSGRARFASPLSAEDFRKVSSILEYTPAAVARAAEDIRALAETEELTAHARAIEIRR